MKKGPDLLSHELSASTIVRQLITLLKALILITLVRLCDPLRVYVRSSKNSATERLKESTERQLWK
jgi:hypothetical protein